MPGLSVDELRGQMARIRARAHRKASRLGEETRQFLDWKHYVRLFPWGTLAAVAAVGYFVVPRRLHVTRPDPKSLAKLAEDHRIVIAPPTETQKRPGLLDGALGLVGNMLLRAGIAYAGQQVGRLMTGGVEPPSRAEGTPHYEPVHRAF